MTGKKGRIHVLIASEHPVFRDGLRQLLEAEPGFEVVGLASSGTATLQLARKLKPEIALCDLAMSSGAAWEILKGLAPSPSVRTIILSAVPDPEPVQEALRLGVRGVISKQSPINVLVRCMRSVMAGEYWVEGESAPTPAEALREFTSFPPPARKFGITPRELEVIAAVVSGRTNRLVAEKLSLSEQTVKHQLTNIFDKLGVSGRLELAVFAANHRLISTD